MSEPEEEEQHPDTQSHYPRPGEILEGKYEIQGVLGAGAMGAVMRAQHLLRKIPVALKFMSPAIMGQKDVVERFLNEGVASSKIDSEHVVKVYDVSKLPSGVPYMVMEFLEGEDLYRLLKREAKPHLPDTARAVHLTLQMLRGLQAAHRVKIVHRDMKPANCFITGKEGDKDFIKIVDFGISKVRPDDTSVELTHAGAALGTPLYMSLEQARSPRDVDARTDLYSVAVILYEMLVGKTPFVPESGTLSELFTMLAMEQPKPLVEHRPDLSPELGEVLRKGLEKERDLRFQTAEQFAEALLPFSDERSDYVASRLLRTLSVTARSRPPPAMSQAPARMTSGTLVMTGPSTAQRTEPLGGATQRDSVPRGLDTAAGTVGTIRDTTVTPPESKRSTPLVWAIAVVAVGAVAAAAWAVGKVTSTQQPASERTVIREVVQPPPPAATTTAERTTAAVSGETAPTDASSDPTSATVAPTPTPPRTGTTAPPQPSATVQGSRPRLNQTPGRD